MSVLIRAPAFDPIDVGVRAAIGAPISDIGVDMRLAGDVYLGMEADLKDILGRDILPTTVYSIKGQDCAAETMLARLLRTPAIPVMDATSRYADQALETVLAAWAAAYPWFLYNPLPRLYLVKANGQLHRPRVSAIHLKPEENGQMPTMAQVLEEWLGAFPGYGITLHQGKLTVAPPRSLPAEILSGDWPGTSLPATVTGDVPHPTRRLYLSGGIGLYNGDTLIERITIQADQISTSYTLNHVSAAASVTMTFTRSGNTVQANLSVFAMSGAPLSVNRATLYLMVYYAPEPVPESSVLAIRQRIDVGQLVNRAVVENSERYEFVNATNVLQPAFFRVWGAYGGPGCYPGTEMGVPTVGDLGSNANGRTDLGLFKLKDFTTTSPYLPPQTVFVPASGAMIVGSYVDVTLRFLWWADQHGDFGGPGASGDTTVIVRAPVGGQATATAWPSLPGPNSCPPEGAFATVVVRPSVKNAVLEGVYITVRGAFSNVRWSLTGGDWAVGLAVLIDGSAPVFSRSNTRIIGTYGEEDPEAAASQQTWGILERRVAIRWISIDAETAASIARGIVQRGLKPMAVYEVDLGPPWLPLEALGYAIQVGDIRGRISRWEYRESHEPDQVRVACTVTMEDVAVVTAPAGQMASVAFYLYYLYAAYGEAAY